MPILVQCTGCKRKIRVRDRVRGKMIKCPTCKITFRARAIKEQPPAPPPPAPPVPQTPPSPSVVPAAAADPAAPSLPAAQPALPLPPTPLVEKEPRSRPQKPFATPLPRVFCVIAGVIGTATLIGFGIGCWIGAAFER